MVQTETLEDPYKFRSPPGGEGRPRAATTISSSKRSVYWSSPAPPRKRVRKARTFRRRSSFNSLASMDTERITSPVNNDRGHSSDPSHTQLKPAKADATLTKAPERVAKRSSQIPQFSLNGRLSKKPKIADSNRAGDLSSEDELHGDTVQQLGSPRGILKRTNFSNIGTSHGHSRSRNQSPQRLPRERDMQQNESHTEKLHLKVHKAVSGKEIFQGDDKSSSLVLVETTAGSNIFEPLDDSGSLLSIPWLNIEVASLIRVFHAASLSSIVLLQHSSTRERVSRTALEFRSKGDAALFAVRCSEGETKVNEKSPDWLESALKNYEKEARKSNEDFKKHPSVIPRPRVQGFQPISRSKGMQEAAFIEKADKSTSKTFDTLPIRRGPETRQTRRSLSDITYRETTPGRWTVENPGWERAWKRSLVYPATGKNRATVDKDDIPRLDEGEFLNDNLVSFYLRYLQVSMEKSSPELTGRIHIFSTFFFEKLQSLKGKAINYEGVKSWTAKIDLFSYDYLIVPVNENAHWYVAIICNVPKTLERQELLESDKNDIYDERRAKTGSPRIAVVEREMSDISLEDVVGPRRSIRYHSVGVSSGAEARMFSTPDPPTRSRPRKSFGTPQKLDASQPRIVTLDSLGASHSPTCRSLREYLVAEAQEKRSIELTNFPTGLTAKGIPEQNNYCDCGIFVLAYVEKFLENPDEVARKLLLKEGLDWTINPSHMRNKVRNVLFDLLEA